MMVLYHTIHTSNCCKGPYLAIFITYLVFSVIPGFQHKSQSDYCKQVEAS